MQYSSFYVRLKLLAPSIFNLYSTSTSLYTPAVAFLLS